MDRVARAYGVRPSAMLFDTFPACASVPPRQLERGLGGEVSTWLTYTFDRAVWLWGQWVESKLAERDAQGRAVWSLERIVSESNPVITENFGGADQLMALVGEGVRIKP